MTARCRCREIEAFEGDEGMVYARDHLRLDAVAEDGWSARWTCPETGLRWCETYQPAWRSGDPGERLERLDQPTTPRSPAPPTSRRRGPITPWVMAAVGITLAVALLNDGI